MKKYLVLGVGFKSDDKERKCPYEVWLDPHDNDYPIIMLEGKGSEGVGGRFKPSEILEDCWSEHLDIAGAKWIIPFCKLAESRNDILDPDALVQEHKKLHGKAPEIRETGSWSDGKS